MTDIGQRRQCYVEETLDLLAQAPQRETLVHGWRQMTAGELRDLVHRMARTLLQHGLGRGHTVALLCDNLPESIAARYAANLIGCAVCHLSNGRSPEVQALLMHEVDCHTLIVDADHAERGSHLAASGTGINVLTIGPADTGHPLPGRVSAEPVRALAEPDDMRCIHFTGGTTGTPKAIASSFARLGDFWKRLKDVQPPGRRQLVCTSLASVAGQLVDYTLSGGGSVVLLDDFDAGTVLRTIEEEQITQIFLPSPLLHRLLDHPDLDRRDTTSLRELIYGTCPASPNRLADGARRLGPVLLQFYGLTETGAISILGPADHDQPHLLSSAGRPLPGVEVSIRDDEDREVPLGQIGEICVRSPSVMQGYWKHPALTARVLQDGRFRTGDLGRLDTDGYLTIVDRVKDVIKPAGVNVYTTEVEAALDTHPHVSHSTVFGVRDADCNEHIHAAVVTLPGSTLTDDELRDFVRERHGPSCIPCHILFLPQLPLTDAGKPDKKLLRQTQSLSATPTEHPAISKPVT